ncbi:hypothetical protein JCM3766R1_001453 [Sporobolomyces carnicolor]
MSQPMYLASRPSSADSYEPPVTPIRATVELLPPPPPHVGPNPRKRAPPSPLDATFSSTRRNHLFTLSTATNVGLGSPSTPTAPLLPAAPIFMPMPVTPTPSKLSSSPMRRSPGIQNFSKFTFDAFNEGRQSRVVDENTWIPSSSTASSPELTSPRASMPNSLGLFDFYREESSPEFSSPELPGSPSSFSDPTGSIWEDESDASCSSPLSPSAIVFARRVSLDVASPSSSCLSRSMPSLSSLPTSHRDPVLGSPVPSLSSSVSTSASSPSSRSSPCGSDTSLSSCSFVPSPTTACLSTFSSTAFFDSPPAPCPPKSVPSFSKTSPLAQRRLESLSRRRLQKLQTHSAAGSIAATPASSPTSSSPPSSSSSGLGLFA